MTRKRLLVISIVVGTIVIAALVLPLLIDVNRHRPQIEAKLEEQLGRPISLGPMRLSLIPIGFRAEDVLISEDPRFHTQQTFAEA